jgi:hypothetical protein
VPSDTLDVKLGGRKTNMSGESFDEHAIDDAGTEMKESHPKVVSRCNNVLSDYNCRCLTHSSVSR